MSFPLPPSSPLLASLPARTGLFWSWAPLLVFAILWADLVRQLSYMWSTNEQYAYGWFVPILAFGLFLKKWPTRPPLTSDLPGASKRSGDGCPQTSCSSFPLSAILISALVLLLLPLRIIHEINQDWSFCSYLLALVVVVLSLYALLLVGGWPWVGYFAFPVCFILVAVNWPYRIENSLKHRLMNAVAALTVEIAGWLNIPALRHGNVIELANSSVGVEDACSGIRSLQSTIMAALFLGELYLLPLSRRFFLLAAGVPLAFLFNIVRTLFLTWQASSAGGTAVAKWHDSAGMTISLLCFGCLWLIALILNPREKEEENRKQKVESRNSETSIPDPKFQSSAIPISAVPPGSQSQFSAVSISASPKARQFLLACGLWSLFTIAATEIWYRAHETDPAQTVRWSPQFPTDSPSARKLGIDKEVRQVLRCDQGDGYSWEEADGGKWSAFFFRWRSGEATSRMSARDHRPEICLPSTGYQVKADLGVHFLPAHGLELPFRAYTFQAEERVLYVFFCLWEDGSDKQSGLGRSKYLDRLDSVLAGKRRLGQQTLEIVVSGYASMAEAEQAVRQRLPTLIQLGAAVPDNMASLGQPGER